VMGFPENPDIHGSHILPIVPLSRMPAHFAPFLLLLLLLF
jgi:hypothetical protein